MCVRAALVGLVAVAAIVSGCDSEMTQPGQATDTRALDVASATTDTFVSDSIPTVNAAADGGCLEEAGTLRARADEWYPGRTGSPAGGRGGVLTTSAEMDEFVSKAIGVIGEAAPGFTPTSEAEYRASLDGCAVARHVFLAEGDEQIIVSIWRLQSAADPFWIANEAPFTTFDDHTLASDGGHLSVVLAVAPDGTTCRLSAYGTGAADRVAGWPSTVAPHPNSTAEPLGDAPLRADKLVPMAHEILVDVLDER
jgi:hypothetical protein